MLTTKNFSTTSALLVALSFSTAPAAEPAKDTLREMEIRATSVADQADELVQISASNRLSAETHITMLMAIKEDVNQMAREVNSLEAERSLLPGWEQRASDKALPLLNPSRGWSRVWG